MIEKRNSKIENVVLIGVITGQQNEESSKEYLDELEFLTFTAGGKVIERFTQKLDYPNPKTFIGTGKLEEVKDYIEENNIQSIIFDDELNPAQLRNIEKIVNCKVLDRTNLILDIFAQRAKTSYAKTQVELAQCQYLLPRLTRMWTHLERQKGGIGLRGPGETEIETDRRIIRDKIVRKVVIKNIPFLLTDTVGFIRKLPTQLIESFKSTLDEVREADLLIHVVDISHSNFEDHIDSVNQIIDEITPEKEKFTKPTLMVFNKIDQFKHETIDEDDLITEKSKAHYSLKDWKKTWMSKMNNNCVFISALKKENIDEFKSKVFEEVKKIHITRFPYNDFLYQDYEEE